MSNPLVTLANMFTAQAPAPAPSPMFTPATPGNIPTTPGFVPTPGNPTAPAVPAPTSVETKSPLAEFATLWQNDPKNAAKPPEPLFNIDSKAIAESAGKVDFRSAITPELATRIKAGGEDGMTAMLEAMNGMSQTVFARAAEAAATITQEGVKKAEQQFAARIPSMIKRQNVRSAIQENPALSNPAAAPMVQFVVSQIQVKHPNASEAEIRSMASDYFDGFAAMISEQSESAKPANKNSVEDMKAYDFSNF